MEKRKDEMIHIWVDKDFKAEIERVAEMCGVSLSEAIRGCIAAGAGRYVAINKRPLPFANTDNSQSSQKQDGS